MFQIYRSKPKGFLERKPLVSICTITFNRHDFLKVLKSHINNQDYPITNIEWIIVDDSDSSIEEKILKDNNLKIKYIYLTERKPIGEKRNIAYPQFSDHYFTGDYPIKPSDNLKGLKVKQLSLLSGRSNT